MRKWLNNYFNFSRSEFNGLIALFVVIIIVTAAPRVYAFMYDDSDEDVNDQLIIKKLLIAPEMELGTASLLKEAHSLPVRVDPVKHQLFSFDPNTIGIEGWVALGLSEKQGASIVKYRLKGGKFRKPEDLKKMYTISAKMYERLLPYAVIESDKTERSVYDNKKVYDNKPQPVPQVLKIVEINSADSAALDDIQGIGPTFSLRIIKYRDRLGGFYKKEQLLEVFGLDSSKYQEIKDQIRLDVVSLRKINVNTANIEDFKNHPYIRYKQANAILQYRKQHGNFINAADLAKVAILPADLIARIAPYLTF